MSTADRATATAKWNAFELKYDGHPLEFIHFFRRWPCSTPRDLLYTLIWNSLLFVLFSTAGLLFGNNHAVGRFLWVTFVITQSVGFTIHGLFFVCGRLLGHWLIRLPDWAHYVYFMLVPTIGVFIGYGIGFSLLDMESTRRYVFSAEGAKSVVVFSVLISVLLSAMFISRDKQRRNELALAAERERATEADRRALEAQLRMLQAQIEPHFLYNTLANAVGLIGPAPDKARHLLEKLIDYLRASLTASREAQTQLGRELNTIAAYLALMQVRMGERLRYRIDCPSALSELPIPPMLLQPLVENAIQHGLEPLIEGGEISLQVSVEGRHVQIQICDSGAGFPSTPVQRQGGGVGLSNLRERLDSLYGGKASLSLTERQAERGICATLRLPLA